MTVDTKGVTLAESAESATIVVTVTSAGAEDTGQKSPTTIQRGVFGGVTATEGVPLKKFAGRATLQHGPMLYHLESSIGPFGRTYGENLGRKVEDWLKKNSKSLNAR